MPAFAGVAGNRVNGGAVGIAHHLKSVYRCQVALDTPAWVGTVTSVIQSFRNRRLRALWYRGEIAGVPDLVDRLRRRLAELDQATKPDDMNAPGFNFHRLQGKPVRYSVHVNGPWCVTFEWDGADAVRVDLEQYH